MTSASPHLDYFGRLMHLDRPGAVALAETYLADGCDPLCLYVDLLEPALIHTGREWEAGRISPAQEHYVSEVTCDLIRRHGSRPLPPPESPEGAPVAVACCSPRERHTIGVLMVADVLRSCGVAVHSLGEGLHPQAVADFVAGVHADLLCVSCALTVHLPDASDLIALARQSQPGLAVAVGGAALRDRGDKIRTFLGADFTAPDARAVRRVLPDWLALIGKSPTSPRPASTNL
jgi:methanogenic corrinoid protein MtbC1